METCVNAEEMLELPAAVSEDLVEDDVRRLEDPVPVDSDMCGADRVLPSSSAGGIDAVIEVFCLDACEMEVLDEEEVDL